MRLEQQRRKQRFSSKSEPSGHVLWHFFRFWARVPFFRLDRPRVSEEVGVRTESLLRNPGSRESDFLSKDFETNNRVVLYRDVLILVHVGASITRQSLKVDPQGPAIPNLLHRHRFLLLSRTDRARLTKAQDSHKIGRQGTDFDKNL